MGEFFPPKLFFFKFGHLLQGEIRGQVGSKVKILGIPVSVII